MQIAYIFCIPFSFRNPKMILFLPGTSFILWVKTYKIYMNQKLLSTFYTFSNIVRKFDSKCVGVTVAGQLVLYAINSAFRHWQMLSKRYNRKLRSLRLGCYTVWHSKLETHLFLKFSSHIEIQYFFLYL